MENMLEQDEDKRTEADRKVEYVAPDDPSYSTERTILADPNNFTIKHPLQNSWTLWYDNPGKKTSQQSWAENLKKIVTFDTVEDFWRIFNNVRPASKLGLSSNYHLFKEHIEPKWEHSDNSKGGKWIVTVKGQKDQLDKMWLWSILACIGENFEDGSEICGIVVSIRKPLDRLALWTKTASNEHIQRSIGSTLKKSS